VSAHCRKRYIATQLMKITTTAVGNQCD